MEGLNSEIQGLVMDGDDSVFKPPVSIQQSLKIFDL